MDDPTRIELETRLLFQEDTLAHLSDVLADQQLQIDRLREAVERLVERIQSRDEGVEFDEERIDALRRERPPHY